MPRMSAPLVVGWRQNSDTVCGTDRLVIAVIQIIDVNDSSRPKTLYVSSNKRRSVNDKYFTVSKIRLRSALD